ncbi:MAG TPA: 4-(cytidine 5'-diphospho)-2-C-methyl-D-erythritol kinase [bacterium]|nr:4-(cytidine 5'-diphospho)-2-C-methyl-D-erythritol kinase [bacterium]
MTAKIPAPAKINLFLETGVPQEGFHPLVSLIDIVDLCDIIEICNSTTTSVSFYPEHDIPAENTITKSIAFLKEEMGLAGNFSIKVFKNIPLGSGLGGGSSNAASVLKTLSGYCRFRPHMKRLLEISARIGKDVPLFIYGKRCIVKGFGEKISEVLENKSLTYLLFIPDFPVSTKDVYRNLDRMGIKGNLTEAEGKIKIILEAVKKSDIQFLEKHVQNMLSCSYFNLYPQAEEVKRHIEKETGKKIFVSGSGGALFAIFATKRDAEEKAIGLRIPGWKKFVACSMETS